MLRPRLQFGEEAALKCCYRATAAELESRQRLPCLKLVHHARKYHYSSSSVAHECLYECAKNVNLMGLCYRESH